MRPPYAKKSHYSVVFPTVRFHTYSGNMYEISSFDFADLTCHASHKWIKYVDKAWALRKVHTTMHLFNTGERMQIPSKENEVHKVIRKWNTLRSKDPTGKSCPRICASTNVGTFTVQITHACLLAEGIAWRATHAFPWITFYWNR